MRNDKIELISILKVMERERESISFPFNSIFHEIVFESHLSSSKFVEFIKLSHHRPGNLSLSTYVFHWKWFPSKRWLTIYRDISSIEFFFLLLRLTISACVYLQFGMCVRVHSSISFDRTWYKIFLLLLFSSISTKLRSKFSIGWYMDRLCWTSETDRNSSKQRGAKTTWMNVEVITENSLSWWWRWWLCNTDIYPIHLNDVEKVFIVFCIH